VALISTITVSIPVLNPLLSCLLVYPLKKDKEYDARNGICFSSEYLVSDGGILLPEKIT